MADFGVRQEFDIESRSCVSRSRHGSFDSGGAELLISIFADRGALRQFLDRIFAHRHPADAPGIQRLIERIRQLRVRDMLVFQKRFHQVGGLPRAAQNCEIVAAIEPPVRRRPRSRRRIQFARNKSSFGFAPISANKSRAK